MRVLWVVGLGLGVVVVASQRSTSASHHATDRVLREAVFQKDVRAIESRLAVGGNPEAREAGGRTLLMEAVSIGAPEIVRALLRGGADPGAATASGWTALHEAVSLRHTEALRDILEAGAPVDSLERVEGTPLDLAERNGLKAAARLLRESGARGSGKSVGDTVCVRPWSGDGYCGVVLDRSGATHRLRVSDLVGCRSGCAGLSECSGGAGFESLAPGVDVEVPTSCLTHTGLGRDGGPR